MNRFSVRLSLAALAVGLVALLATGCSEDAPPGAKKLSFELTDAGCVPNSTSAPAGPIVFEIENAGTTAVTEIEVMEGDAILGEKENLSDGLSGSFSLTLDAGDYTIYCPGGSADEGTLSVTGKSDAAAGAPDEKGAIAQYRSYLEHNTDELVEETEPFVAAVIAGNVAKAKALYAAARIPYERIEPVAESFGDLDPRIDARENDVQAKEFGGFHRIEKALWEENTAKGMAPVAERLLADVEELEQKVKHVNLQAAQIANGANELLGEVSASKITGEEERYSHIDLVDFEANVEGAEAAFEAVEPLLSKKDPKLAKEIEASFKDVYAALKPYRRGDGFVSYTELSKADTRKLAQEIDALAEELSQVPAQIVG
ncbi:MAG TPA: iron uptake system protein EfeO [Solirubrobacterales bacterium]|nr:iron uptake system protein EfeO [Solirubrobacterales bacterium]